MLGLGLTPWEGNTMAPPQYFSYNSETLVETYVYMPCRKRDDKERDLSDQIPGVFSPYSPITKKGGGVEGEEEMNTNIKPCRKNLSQKIHL